ncbi:hypothetical protein [Autumnicola edwardsiae]|jgi:hypothetical protein|uniref:SGNH hydrolase-type esterase domain-containing protein n=1 Tax=Autumnicola edwardsiae TaxID=3075594 RepID=A0ABU3CYV5_9FLAO|nr:hypothetical protein [Zunongwangia sp. F297]MDT0651548.1 hypothetical protein [Zunongwangia sp. F297]
MADRKNHSFTSNFNLRRFFYHICLFIIPVIGIYTTLELTLRSVPFEPKVKYEYYLKNNKKIEILALGASQTERSINPEYLDKVGLNLANSSQGIYANLELFKFFEPRLPNLKLVILGLPYNSIQRGPDFTMMEVHHYNLIFYGVNTFGRSIKPQDYLLLHTNPDFFSTRLMNFLKDESPIKLNQQGFDTNKVYGSYQAVDFKINRINREDIYIENFRNKQALQKNKNILKNFLSYCKDQQIKVLFYSPPSHSLYNALRDKRMIRERDNLIKDLKKEFPSIEFFNEEKNEAFTARYFYNANHLNPKGARKATLRLNEFIRENYNFR